MTSPAPGSEAAGGGPGACPLCGAPCRSSPEGDRAVLRCGACGLMRLACFPGKELRDSLYQEEYYQRGTGKRFLGAFEMLISLLQRRKANQILRQAPGPGRLLDVGCGRGDLIDIFRNRGWEVLGTQVSRTAAEAARKRGLDVRCGEMTGLGLPEGSFDVVTFFHVLEHIDRPGDYLREARSLLSPQGLLVVEVPNHGGPGFAVLGSRHFCFDYPNHLFFFTPATLGLMLERSGFTVVKRSLFSLEYSPFSTLQNMLNLIPGEPNRLYRALMGNREGLRLRKSPVTWMHCAAAALLAPPALLLSLLLPLAGGGNTMRFLCRKT